jgi:integrase
LDSDACALDVVEAIYDDCIDTPKTKNSIRTVPLPQPLLAWLSDFRSRTKFKKYEDFILAGRLGVPGDAKRMLRDYIHPACEDLGIPPATWLTFRRTWATWADGKGVTPKMRGELMGNSAEVNQQVYTKVLPETLRYAVDVVGNELFRLFSNCSVSPKLVN